MTNKKTILITGATGTVGAKLVAALHLKGYKINILSRNKTEIKGAKVFLWDVNKMQAESEAFQNVDYIVHLAGEGIADKKWTDERKKQIIDSRVNSAKLLHQSAIQNKVKLKKFISASAVGFYGADASQKTNTENDLAGKDFLAQCCIKWEDAADSFSNLCDVVKIRLGVVLDRKKGAFPKLTMPIKYGIGAALGSGKQPLPWIHVDDVCNVFIKAIEDEKMIGVYNAVSPDMQTNKTFTTLAAKIMNKLYFMPNIPAFVMRLIFGELSDTFLKGQKVYPQKLIAEKFEFKFETLESAIKDLTI